MMIMLLQNLALSSVDAALPFACHYGKKDLSCGCMPATTWKSCLKHGEYSWNDSDLLIAGTWDSISQIKVMSKRRKLEKNYSTMHPAESEEDKAAVAAVNRIHGLYVERQPRSSCVPTELLGNKNDNDGSTSNSCKICGDTGNILEMLLCDNCEKAFHVSCCNPKIKALPTDEWFCQPCSKMTDKVSLEDAFWKSLGIGQSNSTTKSGSDRIKSMLIHPDQYTSRVRIDKSYQAEVPDWTAQNSQVFDDIGEPEEMDPAETFNSKGCPTGKEKNWLQCRGELYVDARESGKTVCGKWRRAPFSEVQTDDWECSCCVRWDRARADCAVPQELETDKVLLELQHLERLRSRLSARKGKCISSK